jgi:hypothetical protein
MACNRLGQTNLVHIKREANLAAHGLARKWYSKVHGLLHILP